MRAGLVEKTPRSGIQYVRMKVFNPEWTRHPMSGLDIQILDATMPPSKLGEAIQAKVMMNKGREWVIKRVGAEIWLAAMNPQSNILGEKP
mgnify:CR=1 FL=1